MGSFQDIDKWRRPELFLAEVLNKSARGEYRDESENVKVWYRATVIAVDVNGKKLENVKGSGELEHVINGKSVMTKANVGPDNPRNSIKARILTDGIDQFIDDDDLRVFWPMMSEHDSIPIKPGEHVYVTFEDEDYVHGLWFGKVPGHEGVNFFKGDSAYIGEEPSLHNNFDGESEQQEETSDDKIAGERLASNGNLNNLLDDE